MAMAPRRKLPATLLGLFLGHTAASAAAAEVSAMVGAAAAGAKAVGCCCWVPPTTPPPPRRGAFSRRREPKRTRRRAADSTDQCEEISPLLLRNKADPMQDGLRNSKQQPTRQEERRCCLPSAPPVHPRRMQQHQGRDPTTKRRRDLLTSPLLLLVVPGWDWIPTSSTAAAAAAAMVAFDPVIDQQGGADPSSPCLNGGLAPERPIPGAYQNACMELEQRQVPIVVAVVGANRRVPREGGTAPDGGGSTTERDLNSNDDSEAESVVWLTLEQRPSQVGAGATGKAVWNSGILLSRLLQRIAALTTTNDGLGSTVGSCWFHGKTVMELGCGVGLGSLTCAVLGATRVHATDGNDSVVDLAARNVARNRLDTVVTTTVLPWGMLPTMDYSEQMDLVIGSDLTYSPGSWRALAESMETVLKPDGYVLYVSLGHAGFPVNAEVDGFVTVAREMGLVSVASPYDPLWPFPVESMSATGNSLSDLLVQECLADERERDIVESAGGVRVVLLTRKRSKVSFGRP